MPLENVLHMAPNAIANYLNIYYPPAARVTGAFSLVNFSNPVYFVCGMIGGVENTTAPETAKLCAQYLGPALSLLNFNNLPLPINAYLRPGPKPESLIYTDPKLAPGGAGPGDPPEPLPAVSAYTGAGRCATAPRVRGRWTASHAAGPVRARRSPCHAVARALPWRAYPGTSHICKPARHRRRPGHVASAASRAPAPPAPPPGPLLPAEGTPPS